MGLRSKLNEVRFSFNIIQEGNRWKIETWLSINGDDPELFDTHYTDTELEAARFKEEYVHLIMTAKVSKKNPQ